MKRKILFFAAASLVFGACHKATETNNNNTDFATLESQVITDFTNNVALGQYSALTSSAVSLNQAITTLNTQTNDANLLAAQSAWKNIRSTWEQCEGFLFGPVEDNDYDPNTDTWPTDYNQMDPCWPAAMRSRRTISKPSAKPSGVIIRWNISFLERVEAG